MPATRFPSGGTMPPIRDRKYYIHKYNEYMEARNNALNNSSSTTDISMFTNMSQGVTGEDVFS